jgi:hypothetical protein
MGDWWLDLIVILGCVGLFEVFVGEVVCGMWMRLG